MKSTLLTFVGVALFFASSCNRQGEKIEDVSTEDPLQSHDQAPEANNINIYKPSDEIPDDVISHLQEFDKTRIIRKGESIFIKVRELEDSFELLELRNVTIAPKVDIMPTDETDKLNGITERYGFYYELSSLRFPQRRWENGQWSKWNDNYAQFTMLPFRLSKELAPMYLELERTPNGLDFDRPTIPPISDADLRGVN